MLRRLILPVLLIIILAGCATTQAEPLRTPPTKPVIKAKVENGQVCFSEEDAYLLYLYILDLEEGYEE